MSSMEKIYADNRTCFLHDCGSPARTLSLCNNHAKSIKKYGHIFTEQEWHEMRSEAARVRQTGVRNLWSEEARKAHAERSKGRTFNTGRTHFKKGVKPWNKNIQGWMSETHKKALKIANTGREPFNKSKKMPITQGVNNYMWKGNEVGYFALHHWVNRHLGRPDECENCGMDGLKGHKIHWANISRLYKRNLDDWMRLCAKCHKAYDTNKLTLTEIRG